MAAGPIQERNQDATIYVGGLDDKVTETILWELFLQAGPVVNVHMPKDRITMSHQSYGFVEFMSEEDADYAIKIMNMIKLYGKPVRVNKAASNSKNLDIGANLFIGNLDPEIDEKLLYDTFSAFGVILETPKIMRDPDSGNSKGFAFVKFASFDAADAAIDAMNGQHLCNRPISVSYAFKKEAKGERHGSAAERLLAAQNPLSQADRPHQIFADAPPSHPVPPPENRPTQKAPERTLQPHTLPNMQPVMRAPPPLFSAPPPPMQGVIPPALMRAPPPPPPPGSFPMGPPPGQGGNFPQGQMPFRPPPPPGAFQPPPGMIPLIAPPPGGLPAPPPPPPPGAFSAPPPRPTSGGAVPPRPLFAGVPPPPPVQ